jgi:hypothetical protein
MLFIMKKILIPVLLFILTGCPGHHYETGRFPKSVINFEAVNSEFDDYNSTAPFIFYRYRLHFSSNRHSGGVEFDVVGKNMFIEWDKDKGSLSVGTDPGEIAYAYLAPILDSINTPCNELGPHWFRYRDEAEYPETTWIDVVLFANDCNGDYDIRFVFNESQGYEYEGVTSITGKQDVSFLNSPANDMYPSFFGSDLFYFDEYSPYLAETIEKIIFSSDRDGTYDIFEIPLLTGSGLVSALEAEASLTPTKMALSSDYDDTCPFVNGKLMVFASNRPGGYGGFDLYYSEFRNGQWSEAKNFGERINTEYDEFRPITLHYWDFENTLMIFSSNRPGGKGGYDLYYTGISQKVE